MLEKLPESRKRSAPSSVRQMADDNAMFMWSWNRGSMPIGSAMQSEPILCFSVTRPWCFQSKVLPHLSKMGGGLA